jgi:hypothetical protein
MNAVLPAPRALSRDSLAFKKLGLNFKRNKEQDQTQLIDAAAAAFRYEDCAGEYWNPERFSLLYGTPLWEQSTPSQRVVLNQLYWVAYYSQIVSAEIATILLNQTAGAGLYTMEDFRLVCDTLDLETAQERAHIAAFKKVGEETEAALFGKRVFTYPMRSMFASTMVFADTDAIRDFWRGLQLRAYMMLSAGNAFIGCQYFTVRGVRTLNGKIVQHQLSRHYTEHADPESAPIPARISYHHFMDESYHFNSSGIISHDVVKCLKEPTAFERWIANRGLAGCQEDHFWFSAAINGIFWYDPALYKAVYEILTSKTFGLDKNGALEMMEKCFGRETDGLHESYKTHQTAMDSYKAYLADLDFVDGHNKDMRRMAQSDVNGYLATARRELSAFRRACA